MDIEYSVTVQDMEAYLRYHRHHGPRAKNRSRPKASSYIWLAILAIVILYVLINDRFHQRLELLLFFLFGFVVANTAVIFLFMRMGKAAASSVKQLSEDEHSRWIFSPRRMTISPEGIAISAKYENVFVRWPAVWCIRVTDDHAFFFTTLDAAQIVPRHAFRDQQHFEEFIALARRYQQDWDQPTPKPTGIITGLPPESTAITRPDEP